MRVVKFWVICGSFYETDTYTDYHGFFSSMYCIFNILFRLSE
jgi:hypothetical protein